MIILEGPDGSGKSTLGRVLANIFDTEIYHPGGAPEPRMIDEVSSQCVHKLRQGFICDRVNQISEVVYGPVMNDRQLITKQQSLDFMTAHVRNGGLIIYCRPEGIHDMADNQTEDPERDTAENTAKLKANHKKLVAGYDELIGQAVKFDFIARGVFYYDYKRPGEFKRLLDFLNMRGMSTKRPTTDEYFIEMAHLAATRGTCCRRKVGCVLTDANKYVIATGYNGRPKGFEHCSEGCPCSAAAVPSGFDLDGCEALHAEQNALLQCKDPQAIETAYVTLFPCITCTKLLLNTSCKAIVYSEEYVQPQAVELWERDGREIRHQPRVNKNVRAA
jgi:dCMP deaminase